MDSEPPPSSMLLHLPDSCLLAVLQCCAEDHSLFSAARSLFSAARAHSRLHQAAVQAASSIRAVISEGSSVAQQQQWVGSVWLYLGKHGQHVDSIDLEFFKDDFRDRLSLSANLPQLPQHLHRLKSLRASSLCLQLQSGHGYQGVLHAGLPLVQLQLLHCKLLDEDGLAAALLLLPRLQHLVISQCLAYGNNELVVHGSAMYGLQQLTCLKLTNVALQDMQGLGRLTGLQDLWLQLNNDIIFHGSMVSHPQHLTRLCVSSSKGVIQPAVLAGRTALQHLRVGSRSLGGGGSAGVTELLSHLQHLQQLTHLNLECSLQATAPAAAYSALTASSKLHYLNINYCKLPSGVWQHMFPAGKQLPDLRVFITKNVSTSSSLTAATEGSCLVSCCRGLRVLHMREVQYSAELLAPLTGLTGLSSLRLHPSQGFNSKMDVVSQLTGLRWLELEDPHQAGEWLLQLTQLQQLTYLDYSGLLNGRREYTMLMLRSRRDVPVWRRLLRLHLNHSNPQVAQQAAAALAKCADH